MLGPFFAQRRRGPRAFGRCWRGFAPGFGALLVRGWRLRRRLNDCTLGRPAFAGLDCEGGNGSPLSGIALLYAISIRGGFGANAPTRICGFGPAARELNGTGAGLAQGPALAPGHRFIQLMPRSVFARLKAVNEQAAAGPRVKPELLNRASPLRFIENRPHLPRLASIVRNQQKRVARAGLDGLAPDPAVFEIDELDLLKDGAPHARVRLRPCPASIVAHQ